MILVRILEGVDVREREFYSFECFESPPPADKLKWRVPFWQSKELNEEK